MNSIMPRRTKKEALETRNLLLDTAEDVFRVKGVSHTTLVDIAAAAGVTRGAIYWHFENKAALLQAVNDRAHLPFEAINSLIADAQHEDPLARLRDGARTAMQQAMTNDRLRQVFEILVFKCEYVGEMADMLVRRRQNRDDCINAIAENLRHAVARGQLPASMDVPQAALGLYAMVDGLFINWLMDPAAYDLMGRTGELIDIFLRGLQAPAV